MDIRWIEVRFSDGSASVGVAEARGERRVEVGPDLLASDGGQAVVVAARAIAKAGGRLRVDAVARAIDCDERSLMWDAPSVAALARAVTAIVAPRAADPEGATPSDARFWEQLYRGGGDRWELGRAAPPIARLLDGGDLRGKRVLVVGCGRGHEARHAARRGAIVTGVDFAADGIADARALAEREGLSIDYQQRDLFTLSPSEARWDLVLEHTCFCAIDPARRDAYVEVMASVLVEGGELWGLFYAHGRPGGPPFSVTRDELLARFQPRFTLLSDEVPDDSVATRTGQEILARFRRR